MSIVKEFKEFAVKGNMIDLAVGVIIGGAFGKIIDSLVGDIIMPLIAKVLGKPDFSSLYVVLSEIPAGTTDMSYAALKKAGVNLFAYGQFLTVLLNFILLALVVFFLVKGVNKMRKEQEAAAPAPVPEDIVLLQEIRDELKKR